MRVWAMLAATTAVFAGEPVAAQEPGSISYDCDTPAGHFSKMRVSQPPTIKRVSGVLQANARYRDATYAPVAQARLVSDDLMTWVGIKLQAERPEKNIDNEASPLTLFLASRVGTDAVIQENIGSLKVGQPMPFSIELSEGKIIFKIGEIVRSMDTNLGIKKAIELTCSSGDFDFHAITVE